MKKYILFLTGFFLTPQCIQTALVIPRNSQSQFFIFNHAELELARFFLDTTLNPEQIYTYIQIDDTLTSLTMTSDNYEEMLKKLGSLIPECNSLYSQNNLSEYAKNHIRRKFAQKFEEAKDFKKKVSLVKPNLVKPGLTRPSLFRPIKGYF